MSTELFRRGRARLAVHVAGSGPLAILIHGFPFDHRNWSGTIDVLARSHTVAAIDLRGHGASPWAGDASHTMELLADDVAFVARALAPDERADVAGMSMGGYVALALLERHAEVVRSLALIDTRAASDSAEGRAGRDASARAVVEHGRAWLAGQLLPKLLAPGADVIAGAQARTMIEECPAETIVADLRGMRDRVDRTTLLASIAVPSLVIVGRDDTLTPPAEAERMAGAIGGARLVVIDGAGHLTPIERPSEVAGALAEHWAAADARG